MNDWLYNFPIVWIGVVGFWPDSSGHGSDLRCCHGAVGGLLPPLGILFALFVAFVVILAAAFPGESARDHLKALDQALKQGC